MAEKRKIGASLSDSDDEVCDVKRRSTFVTSMYQENESSPNKGMMVNNDSADGSKSFSGYNDFSLKLMVNIFLI
jgi:hypothetical protein